MAWLRKGIVLLVLGSTIARASDFQEKALAKVVESCPAKLVASTEIRQVTLGDIFRLALQYLREHYGRVEPVLLKLLSEPERFELAKIGLGFYETLKPNGDAFAYGADSYRAFDLTEAHELEMARTFVRVPLEYFRFGQEHYLELVRHRLGMHGGRSFNWQYLKLFSEQERYELFLVLAQFDPYEAVIDQTIAFFNLHDPRLTDAVVDAIVVAVRARVARDGVYHQDNHRALRSRQFHYENLGEVVKAAYRIRKNFRPEPARFQTFLAQLQAIDRTGFLLLWRVLAASDEYELPQSISSMITVVPLVEEDPQAGLLRNTLRDIALIEELDMAEFGILLQELGIHWPVIETEEIVKRALARKERSLDERTRRVLAGQTMPAALAAHSW